MSQETIEHSFEVTSPASLKLSNIRGLIDIQAGEDGVITVTAIKHLNSGDDKRTQVIIEQADNGKVVVKTDYENKVTNWFGMNKPCKVDYTVQVPKDCDVSASGVSSKISMGSLNGSLDINSVSGGLRLRNLSGQMKFGTVSGSIEAEALNGELDANSVSGRIRVMDSQISEAHVKTVSGSMLLETPLADGPYTFKGVSGSAKLVVPGDTACSAHFHSVSGRMGTSLPITEDHRQGSRGSMIIQGGGAEVAYKCVSGSFRIVTSEDEKIVERVAAAESSPQPVNQMEILKKIERGEISVETALKELNA